MPTFIDERDNAFDTPTSATRTVLYVEDHPVNVILMQAMCAKRPQVRLVIANAGEDALRLAESEKPQLLLLDLHLPDCHGSDLLKRLRNVPGLAQVPAVAVTAQDASEMRDADFCEIWHKPMDLHTTLSRLDWLLARPEIERSYAAAPDKPGMAEELPVLTWLAARSRQPPPPIPFPCAPHRVADAAPWGSIDAAQGGRP